MSRSLAIPGSSRAVGGARSRSPRRSAPCTLRSAAELVEAQASVSEILAAWVTPRAGVGLDCVLADLESTGLSTAQLAREVHQYIDRSAAEQRRLARVLDRLILYLSQTPVVFVRSASSGSS